MMKVYRLTVCNRECTLYDRKQTSVITVCVVILTIVIGNWYDL